MRISGTDTTFPSPIFGNPYVFTTEIHVKTNLPLYAWPFASQIPVGATNGVPDVDFNGIVAGLSAFVVTSPTTSIAAGRCRWPRRQRHRWLRR